MSEKYSLIVYTNQKWVVKKLSAHLQGTPYSITGISSRIDEIITLLKHHAPNFLIINLNLPCTNPPIHQMKIASPRTRIIIIEEACHSKNIFELIQSGADSFLPVPFYRKDIIQLLTSLLKDEIIIPPFVAKGILEKSDEAQNKMHEIPFVLTERDQTILWCLSNGKDMGEIKTCLGIDENLILAHINNILQKIHFSDIVQNHVTEKLIQIKSGPETLELI